MDSDEESPAKGLATVTELIQSKRNSGYRKQASALEMVLRGLRSAVDTLEKAFEGADNYDPDCNSQIVAEHTKLIKAEYARINKALKVAADIGGAK